MRSCSRAGIRSGAQLLLAGVLLFGACDDVQDPREDLQDPPEGEPLPLLAAAVVSNPTATSPAGSPIGGVSVGGGGTVEVAYVSLPPGTMPDAEEAAITNPRLASTVRVPVVAGGFDPVAIAADAGDTLEIDVRVAGSTPPLSFMIVVPLRRPPIVVRTDPPPQKRDVPLNATMVIVFSEPIDVTTLTGSAVRLSRGTVSVPGRVEVIGTDALAATFTPEGLLLANTEYVLDVSRAIRDLDGDALEVAVRVGFATTVAAAPVASIVLDQGSVTLTSGDSVTLSATAYDTAGKPLNTAIAWSSADVRIATVDSSGLIRGASGGTTTITARAGSQSAEAAVSVVELRFASVRAGAMHTCAVTTDGTAYCWGQNDLGTLGVGADGGWVSTPQPVAGGLSFASVSPGWMHTCGLDTSGTAFCWGLMGIWPDWDTVSTPAPAGGGLRFAAISAGMGNLRPVTCGLTPEGTGYCWGNGSVGELGNGRAFYVDSTPYYGSALPELVSGSLAFRFLRAGLRGPCGLTADGSAYCWGAGDPTYHLPREAWEVCVSIPDYPPEQANAWECSARPVAVAPGLTFTQLSAGRWACGLTNTGAAYCWNGGTESGPVPVAGGLSFVAVEVALDGSFSCGLTPAGAVYCWGQLPEPGGRWTYTTDPVLVGGEIAFASVSVGWWHACGVAVNGAVYCWGDNRIGQLGNGSQDGFSAVPVKVAGQP